MILALRSDWRSDTIDHITRDLLDEYSPFQSSSGPHRIRSLPLRRYTTGNSSTSPSNTTIILVSVFVGVAFIAGWIFVGVWVHRRRGRSGAHKPKKRQHKRAGYMKILGIGLLNNAAPPAISIQRPSLQTSRPISGSFQGAATSKATRYSSDSDYTLELEDQAEQDVDDSSTSTLVEYPATPYDPHGSRSRDPILSSNDTGYLSKPPIRSKNYPVRPISDSSNSYGMFMFRFSNPPRPHDIIEHS